MKRILFLLIAIVFSSPVYAQEETIVEIPLILRIDEVYIKTSSCLRIKEKVYPTGHATWEQFNTMAQDGPEKALKDTISAMLDKDGPRLKELSHPEFGRDPEQFEQQDQRRQLESVGS